jgi:hypothetical protein
VKSLLNDIKPSKRDDIKNNLVSKIIPKIPRLRLSIDSRRVHCPQGKNEDMNAFAFSQNVIVSSLLGVKCWPLMIAPNTQISQSAKIIQRRQNALYEFLFGFPMYRAMPIQKIKTAEDMTREAMFFPARQIWEIINCSRRLHVTLVQRLVMRCFEDPFGNWSDYPEFRV